MMNSSLSRRTFLCSAIAALAVPNVLLPRSASAMPSTMPRLVNRFIAVGGGSEENGQFTADEFEALASSYDLVRIPKFHGHWDRALHHEAARTLKTLNPVIEVHAYFPMSYRFNRATYGRATWRDEYYLRDLSGNLVPDRKWAGFFVDLSNPDYRQWALDIIAGWMQEAPYDAIHFDNTHLFESEPDVPLEDQREDWVGLLGAAKVDAWNDGLREILIRAHNVAPAVTYNGIAPKKHKLNRNLDLLDIADGAMNEGFGFTQNGLRPKSEMIEDVQIMQDEAAYGNVIFQKANVSLAEVPDPAEREVLARYLLGVFALGHEPGFTYFKLGTGYSAKFGEIEEDALEIDLEMGPPFGRYWLDGAVYVRRFQHGWVYVNMEKTPQIILAPARVVLMNGGVAGKTIKRGNAVEIDPEDAVFLMKKCALSNDLTTFEKGGSTHSPPRRSKCSRSRIEAHPPI